MVNPWEYDPDMEISFYAIDSDGDKKELLHTNLPASTWQDTRPISWACPEVGGARKYRIEIRNGHNIKLKYVKMLSATRKNSWESEAGWVLRAIERNGSVVSQSQEAYVSRDEIVDITEFMDSEGNLSWSAPKPGKWTVLRIGNVNTGKKNAPAPPEGTGWECDKLSVSGPETHFAGYIGRLVDGSIEGGLLNGMLLDSWECETQTWTPDMEAEFARVAGYSLHEWLPAVFGYVIDDPDKTARFLLDWRLTMNDLLTDKFYGRMAELAKEKGLTITYETAASDIFPTAPLEYYKHADVPMCEYWHPFSPAYVGSLNFKLIKPTVSAARMYGKPRVSAEAFTSFSLTWDEHFDMFKEVFNVNTVEGATHTVFHTYTHNPQVGFLSPETSFGSGIGSPFMRGQTWWKFMPEFAGYLARCGFMLERGKPVSDVLWYLGDEMNIKPDQEYPIKSCGCRTMSECVLKHWKNSIVS